MCNLFYLVIKMSSYITEEISFTDSGIRISGTLTLPKNEVNPCVILISGYGAETRDYTARGFNRYEFMADLLAKNGIASFRYDDRGCGKSSDVNWHNYTFDDLANEVIKIHSVLKNHHQTTSDGNPSIHPKKIGLFGHSLGATIGPLAASTNDEFSFVISAAPHGLIGVETALHSRNALAKDGGETQEETKIQEEFLKKILKDLQDEKTIGTALDILKQIMTKRYYKTIKEKERESVTFETFLQSTYEGFLLTLGDTPMYRSFLKFNPQDMYKKINCPILLLFAGNDLMHPSIIHRDVILTTLVEADKTVAIHDFSNANHGFTIIDNQQATGFVDNFNETIIDWIREQFNV
ncbi:MAG: alpha/beta hydrolase [Asgard group archaeon]|nr:alpha/beta hydrolase [Asgard group archaeon]